MYVICIYICTHTCIYSWLPLFWCDGSQVAQADLKFAIWLRLTLNFSFFCHCLPSAETTGLYYHTDSLPSWFNGSFLGLMLSFWSVVGNKHFSHVFFFFSFLFFFRIFLFCFVFIFQSFDHCLIWFFIYYTCWLIGVPGSANCSP